MILPFNAYGSLTDFFSYVCGLRWKICARDQRYANPLVARAEELISLDELLIPHEAQPREQRLGQATEDLR